MSFENPPTKDMCYRGWGGLGFRVGFYASFKVRGLEVVIAAFWVPPISRLYLNCKDLRTLSPSIKAYNILRHITKTWRGSMGLFKGFRVPREPNTPYLRNIP